MVLMPRRIILVGAPGVPLIEAICAPGTLPSNAWSIEAEGVGGNLSAEIDSTDIPSLRLLVATPTPVTTTSESDCELLVRFTVTLEEEPAATSLVSYPTEETINRALRPT